MSKQFIKNIRANQFGKEIFELTSKKKKKSEENFLIEPPQSNVRIEVNRYILRHIFIPLRTRICPKRVDVIRSAFAIPCIKVN